MIAVVEHEELDIGNSKLVKNSLCLGGAPARVRPIPSIQFQGLFPIGECAIGVVGAIVVVVPDSIAGRRCHECSDFRHMAHFAMISCHCIANQVRILAVVTGSSRHVVDVADKEKCVWAVL